MECNNSLAITFALSKGQSDGLWKLFGYNLGFKQYWAFSNGSIIVTLFMDAALVVTASTAFKLTAMDPTVLIPFLALDANPSFPMMQLS